MTAFLEQEAAPATPQADAAPKTSRKARLWTGGAVTAALALLAAAVFWLPGRRDSSSNDSSRTSVFSLADAGPTPSSTRRSEVRSSVGRSGRTVEPVVEISPVVTTPDESWPEDGWIDLFDGRSLQDWLGERNRWSIQDGNLVGYIPAGSANGEVVLRHERFFGNALIRVVSRSESRSRYGFRVRWDGETEGGLVIYAAGRQGPNVGGQIFRSDGRPDKSPEPAPDAASATAARAVNGEPDDWDVLTVRLIGNEATTYRNGVEIARESFPRLAPRGSIALRLAGADDEVVRAEFRAVQVLPLDLDGKPLSPAEESAESAGYENGIDLLANLSLKECRGNLGHFSLENGVLKGAHSARSRNTTDEDVSLYLPGEYRDFRFRAVVRTTNQAWSSLSVRSKLGEEADSPYGADVFCVERPGVKQSLGCISHPRIAEPSQTNSPGSDDLRRIIAARKENGEPEGWDVFEVTVRGSMITASINGVRASGFQFSDLRESGPVGIRIRQGDTQENRLEIRDWRLVPLDGVDPASVTSQRPAELQPDDEGWIDLFAGQSLQGWSFDPTVWSVSDGCIVGRAPRRGGDQSFRLVHPRRFGNKIVQVVYKPVGWYYCGVFGRYNSFRDRGVLAYSFNGYDVSMGGRIRRMEGGYRDPP
ncbi:MAG: family 16 glycoside hydrolase, partial [Planctomycetota bacterium]